jgi:hypothetical protein
VTLRPPHTTNAAGTQPANQVLKLKLSSSSKFKAVHAPPELNKKLVFFEDGLAVLQEKEKEK